MLSKLHRFHGRGSLKRVYQHGRTVRAGQLALKYIDSDRRKHWRAAVVVAKKVHKSAVKRNRIRRRIYAVLRQQLAHDARAADLVITVFSEEVAAMPPEKLEQAVVYLLKKAQLLAPKPQQHGEASHDIIVDKEHHV